MSLEDEEVRREAGEDFWIGFIGALMTCLLVICCVLIWRAA